MAEAQKSLRAIFDEASEMPPGGTRNAYLEQVCAGDAGLRGEVEDLLRTHETVGGFLADRKREGPQTSRPVSEREGDRIGRYKLLQKIGEGGCGVVYMAEQIEPVRRRVALKIIKLGMDTRSVVARFEAERQALALMDYTSIARVLDAGATETGRPYFVMELVRGIKITDYCEQNNLSTVARLKLFIQVCQAVQHAHQKGIIHRDIKPSNILVTSNDGVPLPKVIDFGIAKATADIQLTDKTLFTRFEMFIGTPAYMSPEQAEFNALDIDTRTDIYSLGVLLYELLTGHPPFDTETLLKSGIDAMRKAIRETEPTRPSTRLTMELGALAATRKSPADSPCGDVGALHSRRYGRLKETIVQLRGDLDWIILKALEKDRTRRYETANGLAMDIQRHLADEPVIARPPSRLYVFKKTIRRNQQAFAVAAAIVLLLLAGVVFATRDAMRTRGAEKIQRDLRQKAESNQQQAELAHKEADAANRVLRRNLFVREWHDAESLLDQGKTAPALAWFARTAREHPGDLAVQTRLLSLLTERTFALPAHQPFTHGSPVNNADFFSDSRYLVTAALDGLVRIWPLNSNSVPLVLSNRFEKPAVGAVPRANLVLVDDSRSVSLWDLNGLLKFVPLPHAVNERLAISPDGRFAAIYGRVDGLHLWDIAELKPIGQSFEEIIPYPRLAGFTPDGRYVFGCNKTSQLSAWEISSGRLVWQLPLLRGEGVNHAAVHPDGKRVFVSAWVTATGGELSGWTFEPSLSVGPPATASPEGWLLPTRSVIAASCFSQNGNELYVGDAEGHLGVVNLRTHELHTFNGEHDGRITWIALSGDGQQLATASTDRTARIWDVRMKAPAPLVITNGESIWDAKFSPDSRWFVCAGTGAVEIRDAHSASLRKRLPMNKLVTHLDISFDGRRVVACDSTGQATVWDASSGVPLFADLKGLPAHYVEFSSDGSQFLIVRFPTAFGNSTIEVRETETGRQTGPTLTNRVQAVTAHFSPDRSWLVASSDNGDMEFWSLPEGQRLEKPARHKDVIWTTRFSPNGQFLLTSSRDRTAVLWEADSGKRVRDFRHDQQVYDAAFSPDGLRIVTGDASRTAHVWDAQTGQRLFSLPPHPGGVWYCEFSSDGRVLLTGDDAGNARLWEASSGLPLSGWVHNGVSLKRTHLSRDGRMALSAAQDGTVQLWPVLLAPLPAPAWLSDLAEAVAGRRLREDGAPELVPPDCWPVLATALGSLAGDDFYARWARWFFVERMTDKPAAFVP